jgi:hypothetical protein
MAAPAVNLAQIPNLAPNAPGGVLPAQGAGPLPNFGQMHHHLQNFANEVAHLQNVFGMPAAMHNYLQQQNQDQAQILQQLTALTNSVNSLITAENNNRERYASFFLFLLAYSPPHRLDRLPMQLFNVTASNEAPLLYPANVAVVPPYARTKNNIAALTSRLNLNIIIKY